MAREGLKISIPHKVKYQRHPAVVIAARALLFVYAHHQRNEPTPLFSKGGVYGKLAAHPETFAVALQYLLDKQLVRKSTSEHNGLMYLHMTPQGVSLLKKPMVEGLDFMLSF